MWPTLMELAVTPTSVAPPTAEPAPGVGAPGVGAAGAPPAADLAAGVLDFVGVPAADPPDDPPACEPDRAADGDPATGAAEPDPPPEEPALRSEERRVGKEGRSR